MQCSLYIVAVYMAYVQDDYRVEPPGQGTLLACATPPGVAHSTEMAV